MLACVTWSNQHETRQLDPAPQRLRVSFASQSRTVVENATTKPVTPTTSQKPKETPVRQPIKETVKPAVDTPDEGEMNPIVQHVEPPAGLQELSEQKELADARMNKQLERDTFITPFSDHSTPEPVAKPTLQANNPLAMPLPKGYTAAPTGSGSAAAELRVIDNRDGPLVVDSADWIKTHPVLLEQSDNEPPIRLDPATNAEAKDQVEQAKTEWFANQPLQVQVDFNTRLLKSLWLSVEIDSDGRIKRYVVMGGNEQDTLQTQLIIGQLRWQRITLDPPMKPGELAWMRLLIDFSYEP